MMTSTDMNKKVEALVSIVFRNGGTISNAPFFTQAMKEFDGVEDDVLPVLREATRSKRLEINNAWQIIIPK